MKLRKKHKLNHAQFGLTLSARYSLHNMFIIVILTARKDIHYTLLVQVYLMLWPGSLNHARSAVKLPPHWDKMLSITTLKGICHAFSKKALKAFCIECAAGDVLPVACVTAGDMHRLNIEILLG